MNVSDLHGLNNSIGKLVELRGLLASDGTLCWMEDLADERAGRVVLAKDDLCGFVGRQVGVIVGGQYVLAYPAVVSGVLSKTAGRGASFTMQDLTSLIVTTSDGDVAIDLDDNAKSCGMILE